MVVSAVVPKEGWSCISPTNEIFGGRGQSAAVGGPAQHQGTLLLERQQRMKLSNVNCTWQFLYCTTVN